MNRLEHLLDIFGEELSELHVELSKVMRFGMHEQRDLPTSNYDRIVKEWNDVLAMKEMVEREARLSINTNPLMIEAKKKRVEKYLLYSKELGMLNE